MPVILLLVSLCVILLNTLQANSAHADPTDPTSRRAVLISYSEENEHFVDTLEHLLHEHPLSMEVKHLKISHPTPPTFPTQCEYDLVIAVGYDGLKEALKLPFNKPVLSTLIYKYVYDDLLKSIGKHHALSAIFLGHPLDRYFELVRSISTEAKITPKLGVILGPTSLQEKPILTAIAKKHRLELCIHDITSSHQTGPTLNAMLDHCSIMLALPDPVVYNRQTARGLLLTALRHNVPFIGYSKAYVNLGALSAVYSTKQQHAHEISTWVAHYFETNGTSFLPPAYSTAYTIAVNYQAAHQLKLFIKNTNNLTHHMESLKERL